MKVVRSVSQLRSAVRSLRAFGETVALCIVEGEPQEGHADLIDGARRLADRVIMAVAPEKDAEPLREDDDGPAALDAAGCDLLYAPDFNLMWPSSHATELRVAAAIADSLDPGEAARRDRAARLGARFLIQTQPDIAVLPEAEWFDLVLLRRVAADFDLTARIEPADTPREEDGLAIALANLDLEDDDRAVAPTLHRVLRRAAASIASGAAAAGDVLEAAAQELVQAGFAPDPLIEMRAAADLALMAAPEPGRPARLFASAELAGLRLIESLAVET